MTFYLIIMTFFLTIAKKVRIALNKVRIASYTILIESYNVRIAINKVRVASFNCNSDVITCNCKYISQFQGKSCGIFFCLFFILCRKQFPWVTHSMMYIISVTQSHHPHYQCIFLTFECQEVIHLKPNKFTHPSRYNKTLQS